MIAAGKSHGAWALTARPVGLGLAAAFRLVVRTSTVSVVGPGAAHEGPAVYVNWHRHLPFLIVHHGQLRRWMMVSGAPHMGSIARFCELSGLRLVRGATGERGREALGVCEAVLRRGDSIVLAVDGPAGPPFVVKPGCVDLARTAAVPIIPVACRSGRGHTVHARWDRMLLVSPFDAITVEYGEPLDPAREPDDARLRELVRQALDRLDRAARSG
ncbi:MAG: DUF374 domain-containing protein [Myxococcales bacterium]